MPSISDDGKPAILDEGEFPLEEEEEEDFDTSWLTYSFDLWKPAVVDGHVYQVGEVPLLISKSQIERRQATVGGDLAKYLLPRVVRRERKSIRTPRARSLGVVAAAAGRRRSTCATGVATQLPVPIRTRFVRPS